VSPFCRVDDNASAGNGDWAGAWSHDNPVEGELGYYAFELSRSLITANTETDGQMTAGGTQEFGVAFWDPFESEEGWSDPGHYVTGCINWIELELVADESTLGGNTESDPPENTTSGASTSLLSLVGATMAFVLTIII
jgi:hypothetical protein